MRDRVEQDELDHDIGAGQWEPLPDDWERYDESQDDLKGQSDCAAGLPHIIGRV